MKESEFIEGHISNLQLSADGNKAVYVTDNKKIQLLDTITATSELILLLDKPIQFVKMINLSDCNIVLCRWEDSNLKVRILNSLFKFFLFLYFPPPSAIINANFTFLIYPNFNCNYLVILEFILTSS